MNVTFVLFLVSLVANNHTWCMYGTCSDGLLRYNCMDFTKDAVVLLRQNNITAYPMCGYYNHKFHYWLGIEINNSLIQIEPQSAQIVYPDDLFYVRGRHCISRGLY